MKKIYKNIFLYLFLISSLLFSIKTSAFLSEDLGEDLYKKLDKSVGELETKMFTKEITGNGKKQAYEVLNNYANTNCFGENTRIEATKATDIKELFLYIKDECKDKDGNISILQYQELQNKLNSFIEKNKQVAKQKTETIYKISRIGLYSDGTTKNSPFDLIFDLQEIDKIIFGEDLEYEGEELDFLEKYNKDPISTFIDKVDKLGLDLDKEIVKDTNLDKEVAKDKELADYIIENPDGNNYLCTDFKNNSGLNKDELSKLTNITYRNYNPLIKLPNTKKLDTPSHNYEDPLVNNGPIIEKTGYKKTNDNGFWPCNDFFCINIDFTTYNQELLGYGADKSIKAILEISNGHLKKIVSTSLQQAKQATNNFELSLSNIDLSEIFHMGVQVDTKPVPLLNLENKIDSKSKKADDNGFELKKQLDFYYKSLGINPERVNDLYIFKDIAKNKKTIIDSAETSNSDIMYKDLQKNKIEKENSYKIDRATNTLDSRIGNNILSDFNNQFNELEIFTKSLGEYSNNNYEIVKAMRKIPINKK